MKPNQSIQTKILSKIKKPNFLSSIKKNPFFPKHGKREMVAQLKLGDVDIEKNKFHSSKKAINIKKVHMKKYWYPMSLW